MTAVENRLRTPALLVALGLLSAGAWWSTMAWDSTYQIDPNTGYATGPYEAWQVVACGAIVLVLSVVAGLLLPPVPAILTITGSFTAAWCLTSIPNDDSGLSAIGAILVFIGVGVTSTVLVFCGWAVKHSRAGSAVQSPGTTRPLS